jgi:hypothetical protein
MRELGVVTMEKAGKVFRRGTCNDRVSVHQSNHASSPKIQGRRHCLGAVCCYKRAFQANAKVVALKLHPQGAHVRGDLGLTMENAVPLSHTPVCMQQTNPSLTGGWLQVLVTNHNHAFQPACSRAQRNYPDALRSGPHLIIASQLSGTCRQSGSTKHPGVARSTLEFFVMLLTPL